MTKYTTLDVGEKLDYTLGWDDEDWLGADTIASSDWVHVNSGTGLTLTGETSDATTATVFAEATVGGTWRLRNSIVTVGGRKGVEDLVVTARSAIPEGYLSPEDAEDILWGQFAVEADLAPGDLVAASEQLDEQRPFIGARLDEEQDFQFPRDVDIYGNDSIATEVPAPVLTWVALAAYRLSVDDDPPVTAESAGSASTSYGAPKPSQTERRMASLLDPYLRTRGSLA